MITTRLYRRVTRGFGDAVMLRPAIIGNMRKYPNDRHILHIHHKVAPIFYDIQNLEIFELTGTKDPIPRLEYVSQPKFFEDEEGNKVRYKQSLYHQMIGGDLTDDVEVYELSTPCAEYETKNMPNVQLSRQQIYCYVVGVDFSIDDYNVSFDNSEIEFADTFLRNFSGSLVGIHPRSFDIWRDYRYMTLFDRRNKMTDLIKLISKKINGYVIVFDDSDDFIVNKNVIRCYNKDVRRTWAIMSRMNLGIGIDSMGIHLMGSCDVPVYGIFGPTDPSKRLLYSNAGWNEKSFDCQYCWYRPCDSVYCMNSKSVEYYWDDIKRKMGGCINV